MKACWIGLVALMAVVSSADAEVQTYVIEDIGTSADYSTPDIGQSYSGTGFVGMYATEFVHLFGVEQTDHSRTALQADISGLGGVTIQSAFLSFDLTNGNDATQNVTVTSFTADGSLEHFWTPPDNLGSAVHSVTGLSSNVLDVTSFLRDRVAAGDDWLGLHLQGSTEYQWADTSTEFGANADEANVRLVVDYGTDVPEPATLTLLGVCAIALGCWRRMVA